MALGDQLLSLYARQKTLRPGLRKGQFMQELFDDKYKNEASARRAFNKVSTQETSGRYLERDVQRRNKLVGPRGFQRGRYAGGESGLWKINVTFYYKNQDGETFTETRSFIAYSGQYRSVLDMPYVAAILEDTVDDHIEYWMENQSMTGNWFDRSIEVFSIERSDLPEERMINLDTLEIEDGEYDYEE